VSLYAATPVAALSVPASRTKSFLGVVNREAPQSKQTNTFGNNQTLGLVKLSDPEKWIFISAGNSASLRDRHDGQDIGHLLGLSWFLRQSMQAGYACMFNVAHISVRRGYALTQLSKSRDSAH
jgi:hypothetical protein